MAELPAIAAWHDYIGSRDAKAMREILHPDIVFESPVVHRPQIGREIASRYISAAVQVLGGPAFAYVDEWRNAHGVALEFINEIGSIRINGVDLIRVDADGRLITGFKVLIRPLKAIELVHRLMAEQLERG